MNPDVNGWEAALAGYRLISGPGSVDRVGELVREIGGARLLVVPSLSASGGWAVGAELIVSSTDAGGVPEYHTVAALSEDGRTVHLAAPLASSKVGTLSSVAAAPGSASRRPFHPWEVSLMA